MKKHLPYMMASSLIAAILLAGCSSNTDTSAQAAGGAQTTQTQSGSDAAQPGAAAGTGQNRMDRAGMNIGKIKSISGNTITVYTADMPARQQNGGREGSAANGGGAAPGDGTGGAPADGQGTQGTPPESGQAPDGTGKDGGQGGGRQGGGMGGGMMQNFSEETTDITVGSDTTYVSVTFDNGEQKETTLALSDLKADDIIQYTLKTDTTEAEKITLGTGGFGGGMGGGGRGQGQGQGAAPAGDAAADSSTTNK